MRHCDGNLIYTTDGEFVKFEPSNGDQNNSGLPEWFFHGEYLNFPVVDFDVFCDTHPQGSPLPDFKIQGGLNLPRQEIWDRVQAWWQETYG